MRLHVQGVGKRNHSFPFTNDLVINQGGEALILKDPQSPDTYVVKVYHTPDAKRASKLHDFIAAAQKLPASAVKPLELVVNDKGDIVGFCMRRLSPRFRKLSMLFKPSFATDHGFTAKKKTDLLLHMAADLSVIHPLGFVVGDLSAANEMVNEDTHELAWIDVDGWQTGKYACVVATQLYVSPELYGVDLSKKPSFLPRHDWWSFAVIATQCLLNGIHPFKSGLHPKLNSPLDRAEKGVTVFDNDVTYPNVGLSPEVLSDALAHELVTFLKRKGGETFPVDVLRRHGDMLIECRSCKTWHTAERAKCPVCSTKAIIDVDLALKIAGIELVTLVKTRGRILHSQVCGRTVQVVVEESGDLVFYFREENARQESRIPTNVSAPKGCEYSFVGDMILMCPDPLESEPPLFLFEVGPQGLTPVKELVTRSLEGGQAVFATTSQGTVFRIINRMLVATERNGSVFTDRPVMQVFDGQTWFTADGDPAPGENTIIGYHREFDEMNWFISVQNRKNQFVTNRLTIPKLLRGEAIVDIQIYYSSETALIVRQTRMRGVDKTRIDLVKVSDGSVLSSRTVRTIDEPQWDVVGGKAYGNKKVLHATSRGIISENVETGDTRPLDGTQKCVGSDDALDRLGGGILVVKTDRVLMIKHR